MPATSASAHLQLDERIALGRAARERRPRASIGTWRAPSYRRDPVELLGSQETDRLPALVPIRHARMAASAFAFYRGSAIVMAADLGSIPSSDLTVQLNGDAHLGNFGVFRAPDRRLVFDGDDYDETLSGPFEWDVLRLATSFVLAGLATSPSTTSSSASRARASAGRKAALTVAATYRASMRENAPAMACDLWYAREDEAALREWSRNEPKSNRLLAELRAGKSGASAASPRSAVEHFTTRVGGRREFREGPLLSRIGMRGPAAEAVLSAFDGYLASLAPERRLLAARYEVVDLAHKVVGVGSVGLPDVVALVRGGFPEDLLILQVKTVQASALTAGLPSAPTQPWSTDAERVVLGARLSQPDADVFLGPADSAGAPSRYVRQLRDGKWVPDPSTLSAGRMVDFARMCGHSLARAHARTGDPVAIAAYLGRSTTFDTAVASFAKKYAEQVTADARAYRAAIASGRLTAATTIDRAVLIDQLAGGSP